ncbi:MAG: hypothetical protein WCI65_13600 [Synechococcaceae cyanobacterium ELA263]
MPLPATTISTHISPPSPRLHQLKMRETELREERQLAFSFLYHHYCQAHYPE